MRILCIGGGPAGLYLALLMKKADPRHAIRVVERNRPYDTFGWGVVFSDNTLGNLEAADPETARRDHRRVQPLGRHRRPLQAARTITSGGHGFCGIGRKRLLNILQKRCEDARRRARVRDRRDRRRRRGPRVRRRPRHRVGRHQQPHPDALSRRVRARRRRAPLPLRLARHEAALQGVHVRVRRNASTAGSRRTPTSSTATPRRSSSRRPKRSGRRPGSSG